MLQASRGEPGHKLASCMTYLFIASHDAFDITDPSST